MLHEFLSVNREELISRCRVKAGTRIAPRATHLELENGIPVFLEQLTEILRVEHAGTSEIAPGSPAEIRIRKSATSHGNELLLGGFNVSQVVHGYGDLCQAITELAIERNELILNNEFQTLNRCLDNAIATAVSEFAHQRDRMLTDATDRTTNERLGFLAHEFRNLLNTAILAVDILKSGGVGIAGSTGAILDRSLIGMRDLCARALVDVRLRAGIPERRERILVANFLEEIEVSAAIDANSRDIEFVVPDVTPELAIEADRQIMGGAVTNLLQNAFKFTKPGGRVSLTASLAAKRVLIEVEDECGGLPPGNPENLFESFKQRGVDRSGVGLGLGISRRSVEANGGTLYVRDLPGTGCIFTIDLPHAGPSIEITSHVGQ